MTLPTQRISHAHHSHKAIVDSGTPLHIFHESLFLTNPREDHTPVSGFQGSTSRATHRGDLACRLLTNTQTLTHHIEPDSLIIVPDTVRNLFSVRRAIADGHSIIMQQDKAGIYLHPSGSFVPFEHDPETGLCLLPLYAPAGANSDIYPITSNTHLTALPTTINQPATAIDQIVSSAAPPNDLPTTQSDREQALALHHQLCHINTARARALDIKGIPAMKQAKHFKCPTCLASKARRNPRQPPTAPENRPSAPWQDVHVDLSGKMLKTSRGHQYFVAFVCRHTGAKHVDFISHKNHFILAPRAPTPPPFAPTWVPSSSATT